MAAFLIWVFTVDTGFTLSVKCAVSTLVGMSLHNICIFHMFTFE